jgi:hypothetical protein
MYVRSLNAALYESIPPWGVGYPRKNPLALPERRPLDGLGAGGRLFFLVLAELAGRWRLLLAILTNRTESSQREDDAPGAQTRRKTLPLLPMCFPIEFSGKLHLAWNAITY